MLKQTVGLSIQFADRKVMVGKRPLRLTKRFFNLYCLLAAARKDDPQQNGGFVDLEQIRHLPYWERNEPISVGKQISRHVLALRKHRGLNLIEAEQKTGGPFRLAVPASSIELDVSTPALLYALALPAKGASEAARHAARAFRFYRFYWTGAGRFDDGLLDLADEAFRGARAEAAAGIQRLAVDIYLQRILERRGDLDAAEGIYRKVPSNLTAAGRFRLWAESRNLVLAAWRQYRRGDIEAAERLNLKALALIQGKGYPQVLGDIYNGLGEVCKARIEYAQALSWYFQALEQWFLAEYFYGFQAVCFNIGRIHRLWGDQLRKNYPKEAKEKYRTALAWVEECTSLCKELGIGYDTCEAEVMLSNLHYHLGTFDKALSSARRAREIAAESSNQRSIVLAARALADVYLVTGKAQQARAVIGETRRTVKRPYLALLGDDLLTLGDENS